jgi:hypothetical protein
MSMIIEDVTIETFPDAIRRGQIQPGQRFSIVIGSASSEKRGTTLAEIAAGMRATAAARGLTTEIFDRLIAEK